MDFLLLSFFPFVSGIFAEIASGFAAVLTKTAIRAGILLKENNFTHYLF
jgi:hypothetical protein